MKLENPEHNTLLFDSDIAIDLDDSDTHSQLLALKKFFQSTTFYPDKTNLIRFIDSALDSYLREYSRLHGTTDDDIKPARPHPPQGGSGVPDKNTPISIDSSNLDEVIDKADVLIAKLKEAQALIDNLKQN